MLGRLPSALSGESITDLFLQPEMSADEFDFFRLKIRERAGINFLPKKQDLVKSRLFSELRRLKIPTFAAYRAHLEALSVSDPEWRNFTNILTTNKTSFFREGAHFDFLIDSVLPEWKKSGADTLRIWSCASSTGEELYSLSMAVDPFFKSLKCEILGTDIDTEVLAYARNGVYRAEQIEDIPEAYRLHVKIGCQEIAGWMRIENEIKHRVHFESHNLMDKREDTEGFDIIFCRNVLIYFDKPTTEEVVENLRSQLRPGGYLFVSHSEAIQPNRRHWDRVFPSVYRKR